MFENQQECSNIEIMCFNVTNSFSFYSLATVSMMFDISTWNILGKPSNLKLYIIEFHATINYHNHAFVKVTLFLQYWMYTIFIWNNANIYLCRWSKLYLISFLPYGEETNLNLLINTPKFNSLKWYQIVRSHVNSSN